MFDLVNVQNKLHYDNFQFMLHCQYCHLVYKLWLIKDSNITYLWLFYLKPISSKFQTVWEGTISGFYCSQILKVFVPVFVFGWNFIFLGLFFRTFKAWRTMIERCFGILKNSYCAVGTRRYRSRRWNGPLICNLTAALYNRRKIIFHYIHRNTGRMFMTWLHAFQHVDVNHAEMFHMNSLQNVCGRISCK